MCVPVTDPHLADFSDQQMQEVQPSELSEKGRGKLSKQVDLVVHKKMVLEAYQMPELWPSKPGDRGKDRNENN